MVSTSPNTHCVSITKRAAQLYQTNNLGLLSGQEAEFHNIEADGTYIDHWLQG
jgi:hypothetical protein